MSGATSVTRYSFAVYPADMGHRFEPFILDVPTLSGVDFAARRAYWQAFHLLGPRGVEPEEMLVCQWCEPAGVPGRAVGPGGFIDNAEGGSL